MIALLTIIALLDMSFTRAQEVNSYSCARCYNENHQFCLFEDELTQGLCCDDRQTAACGALRDNRFCVQKDKMKNETMRDFGCPANNQKCPASNDEITVRITEKYPKVYNREHAWNQDIPDSSATSWNCKYLIMTDRALVSSANVSARGYTFLQVESYGFDEDVYLIVQEHNQYKDYLVNNLAVDPVTQIYRVYFGSKFYIPAEYDLLLTFEPIKAASNVTSKMGKIKFRTWW